MDGDPCNIGQYGREAIVFTKTMNYLKHMNIEFKI